MDNKQKKYEGHELKGTMEERIAADTIDVTLQTLQPGEKVMVTVTKREEQPMGSVDVTIQTSNPKHYIFPAILFTKSKIPS